MALTCARCGAQNIEGNRFCQVCGTPLTAVGAGAPAAVAAPPGFAQPPGYQSPYYPPAGAGAQAQVHRTPWLLIVSAVVVLVLLMAGGATAIALLGNRAGSTSGSGIAPQVSSPSPGGPPSPIASPTTLAGQTASNDGETIPVPTGWAVDSKDNQSITISDPSGTGSVTIGSGPSNPNQSAQQNKDTLDKFFAGKYPDTKDCLNSKTTTGSLDGAPGIFWQLCFTLVSGGQSFSAAAPIFAGANADGSVFYVVLLLTPSNNLQSFINEAAPILSGIQWKLQ